MTTYPAFPRTVCILGCGGFIGSHLVERILGTTDWLIYGIDRSPSKISEHLANPKFTYANINIESPAGVEEYIKKSDAVISLVALCNPSLYNTIPLEVIRSNFTRPLEIVDRCAALKKWLIHFSTCEVYGTTVSHQANVPFNSGTDVFKEETTPFVLGPIHAQRWTYACAKQLLERAIYGYGFERGLAYTVVRPFNFIGPRMDFLPGIDGEGVPRVLACFMEALLSQKPLKLVDGGRNRRCFTAIEDAVGAVMAILAHPDSAKGRVFNVGNPRNETTIAGLAGTMIALYRELLPESADFPYVTQDVTSSEFYGEGYEDSDRRVPDITLAKTLLGWEPAVPLDKALRTAMAFYIKEYANAHAVREAI
ncbi:MAG TPA: bifunctional UDP-4-keto-pentose/UDP-xylose synthase [Chitinivibrionales bacterium]|nr:bifunctional UDP-4-keto-pentose/UDP-xylose synthase [Chitinivibrionales bacterium]